MLVQFTKSVKMDGVWRDPGFIGDVEVVEANRLITLKACTKLSDAVVEEVVSGSIATGDELEEDLNDLQLIDGVTKELATTLYEAGYKTVEQVAEAQPGDLKRLKGIGKKNVQVIQDSAEEMLEDLGEEDLDEDPAD